jgi:hypothetical protein
MVVPSRRRSRSDLVDLLTRPPASNRGGSGTDLVLDPADQLEKLAQLVARGLLTIEEFERQRRRILEG